MQLKKEFKIILNDLRETPSFLYFLMAFIILLLEYFGWQGPFYKNIAPIIDYRFTHQEIKLWAQSYTTLSFLLLMVLIPAIVFKWRADLKFEGLSLPYKKELGPYLLFAIVMLLILSLVCAQESFYQFYPLYRPKGFTDWMIFELIYLPQFIAVEFFFRGPILFALNKRIGRLSIFMMTLPYAIIHIHKPFPEAIGSIFAGVILCHYSLKSKSIWPGVLLHMTIALGADFFGLYYSGLLSNW